MWKLSVLAWCGIVLVVQKSNYCDALLQPNYTRLIEAHLPNPATVRLGSDLYTISKSIEHLSVNSTSGKSCRLRVNPLDEYIQRQIEAMSLQVNRKILVWGLGKSRGRRTRHILLIVDPDICKYTPVNLPEETGVLEGWVSHPAQIVAQDRTREFRVFYQQGLDCSPCRFNYDGERLETNESFEKYRFMEPAYPFWILAYPNWDGDKYFYAFNFANRTSILHLLSTHLEVEETVRFDHAVNAASVTMGAYQNTAICYVPEDGHGVICERLDMQMWPGITWQLPLPDDDVAFGVSVTVDEVGNTFIGVLLYPPLYLFVYNARSELVAHLDFGEIDTLYSYQVVKGIPMGDEFCLQVIALRSSFEQAWHVVKCVNVSEYIKDNAMSFP